MSEVRSMTLRIPVDQAEALETIASVVNRPVAEVVRTAIAHHIEELRNDANFQRSLNARLSRAERLLAATTGPAKSYSSLES